MRDVEVVTLPVHWLKAHLMIAADSKDSRYYLQGCLVEPSRARFVSTDGRVMLISGLKIRSPAKRISPFIIPRTALETAIQKIGKTVKAEEGNVEIRITAARDEKNRVIELCTTREKVSTKELEGSFPDYGSVIPRECSGTPTELDMGLLCRLHRALSVLQDTTPARCLVHISHNGPGPALLSCENPLLLGVLVASTRSSPPVSLTLEALGLKEKAIKARRKSGGK